MGRNQSTPSQNGIQLGQSLAWIGFVSLRICMRQTNHRRTLRCRHHQGRECLSKLPACRARPTMCSVVTERIQGHDNVACTWYRVKVSWHELGPIVAVALKTCPAASTHLDHAQERYVAF